jgi:hypothetical protein
MLPEIVRAAAEPMASIDSMTVLSTEGASDVVKNATRTVTEAGAVVKGLTGLDVPGLISGAIRGDRGGGTGGAEGGFGGEGGSGRRGAARRARPAPSPAGASAGATGRARDDVSAAARDVSAEARATAAVSREAGAAARRAGREAEAAAARAGADAQAAIAAGEAASRAAMARTEAAIGDTRARVEGAVRAGPAAAGIARDTTVNVAAQRLARDLAAIPGIEQFGGLRLADLDRAGPRPLRTMWRLARHELAGRYGEMTIGEMVDRFSGGGAAPSA